MYLPTHGEPKAQVRCVVLTSVFASQSSAACLSSFLFAVPVSPEKGLDHLDGRMRCPVEEHPPQLLAKHERHVPPLLKPPRQLNGIKRASAAAAAAATTTTTTTAVRHAFSPVPDRGGAVDTTEGPEEKRVEVLAAHLARGPRTVQKLLDRVDRRSGVPLLPSQREAGLGQDVPPLAGDEA